MMKNMDKVLFDNLNKDLGEITDVEILTNLTDHAHVKSEIRYKSNGVQKAMHFVNNDAAKYLILCACYVDSQL